MSYVRDSIIEPTISKDVLEDEEVRKPALLRSLFELGARFSAQELSYSKMLGQLNDAGNTTTLAHYLDLLSKARVLCGLPKFHPKEVNRRKSSPRLMVYDTSLMPAAMGRSRELLLSDSELRGHLVESAVGAHLLALAPQHGFTVSWWREGTSEVDFVVSDANAIVAIEVKSGRMKPLGGMAAFLKEYPKALRLVVGGTGPGSCTLEDFLMDRALASWGMG
ncbi:ATP-binding protein [Adlercreutzia equolifaciens]